MLRIISALSACLVASALVLSSPNPALAQGRGQGQAKKADKVAKKADKADNKPDKAEAKQRTDDRRAVPRDVAIDRDGHVRVIHDYVRGGSLPPGLAKRQSLPPGLAKQLRERGELPPGLERHWVAVPRSLESRLPHLPSYYHRYFAGDDLVVVDTRSDRIAYLIRDVLR
jgi:hypothetical protein